MIPFERRRHILRILQQQPGIRVSDLARALHVTEATVRADLRTLEQQARVKRVHGGAVLLDGAATVQNGLTLSALQMMAPADWIARWAADLVEDGDAILLDAGELTLRLVRFLHDRRRLTVVTNGIETAQLLAHARHTVILLGGVLGEDGRATTGLVSAGYASPVHCRLAFVTGAGFTAEDGLMDDDLNVAESKQRLLDDAASVIALVESVKLGQISAATSVPTGRVARLFTDAGASPQQLAQLQRLSLQLTICGESTVTNLSAASLTPRYKIGFANLSEEIPFAVDVRRSLERAVSEYANLELIVADNQLEQARALENAENFVAAGVHLAIEYQIDALIGTAIMHKYQRAGIPVIAVDIPMVGATYFGVDNFCSGQLAGRALGEWIKSHWRGCVDRLLILEEPRAGALPQARIEGQLLGLEEIIGTVATDRQMRLNSGNTCAASEAVTVDALAMYPEDRHVGVISFNDDAAIGALHAAHRLQRTDHVVIVGQGADRLVREELRRPDTQIIGSTAFIPERYGEKLIDLALRILRGEPVSPAVFIDHVFIDSSNVDVYYSERSLIS